jgi:hypothetical protein
MGVVIAVAGTGVRTLVSVLVCLITMFDYDYFFYYFISVLVRVIAIAAVAGGESHRRYHHRQGRGGSVNVHSLCFLERISLLATTPHKGRPAYRIST